MRVMVMVKATADSEAGAMPSEELLTAMGAFNEWATGSFLETPANRRVVTVALNILHGAAVIMRSNTLHNQGVRFSPELSPAPLEFAQIKEYLS